MGPKVKLITLWTQVSRQNFFDTLKTGLERRGCHQYQADPCLFYRKVSVISTYDDDYLTVSHKQETIT